MKKVSVIGIVFLSALFLTACRNDTSGIARGTRETVEQSTTKETSDTSTIEVTKTDVTSETATSESTQADTPLTEKVDVSSDDESVIARADYTTNWSEEWRGLTTKITRISIIKMDEAATAESSLDGEGIIGFTFELENTGQLDLSTYPDQATLVIDSQQLTPNVRLGDNLGGEILSSVSRAGMVVFNIPVLADPAAISEVRLKWRSSDVNAEDIKDMTKTHDVVLTLPKE